MSIRWCIAVLATFATLLSCRSYPYDERREIRNQLNTDHKSETLVSAPTRIHLVNGSVLVCERGFILRRDSITAYGKLWDPLRNSMQQRYFTLPLDSVVGVEVIAETTGPGRAVGGLLLSATGSALTVMGSVVIFKAIFGSCPTVYTLTDTTQALEAELFSYSIASTFEADDVDVLRVRAATDGSFRLRLRNEALETHYIDRLALAFTDHPAGTTAVPDGDGHVLITGPLQPPRRIADADDDDVTGDLLSVDGRRYTTPVERTRAYLPDGVRDQLDCEFDIQPDARDVVIVIDARNSLENTVLLYDVMMRGQGAEVLAWQEMINSNLYEAYQLYRWYRRSSGIEVLVERNGEFVHVGRIEDTGPIAWKTAGLRIPIRRGQESVRLRLRFIPDSWTIDRVALGTCVDADAVAYPASLVRVSSNTSIDPAEVTHSLASDDDAYLTTLPGDRFDLEYTLPPRPEGARTLFVQSRGYYIEWVRQEWLREADAPGFDIRRSREIRQRLADLWQERKDTLETQFYSTKIPSWEPTEH